MCRALLSCCDAVCCLQAALRELKARVATLVHDCSELIKFGRELSKREAYISLCDTLVVFSRALRGGQLEGLVYTADAQLQQTLLDYVLTSVLVPDEEEEEEEGREEDVDGPEEHLLEHAMRLNDRRIQLAGFLKLGMYSAVDMTVLSSVFAQYLMVSWAELAGAVTLCPPLSNTPTLVTS